MTDSMSGDRLSFLLFFVGTAVAAVMGAVQSTGIRAKILWATGVAFGAMAYVYFRWSDAKNLLSALSAVWALGPAIAMAMAMILVSGWERKKPPPFKDKKPEPILNPALTPEYLNQIVKNNTEFESERKIREHQNQLCKIKGQVKEIKNATFNDGIVVDIAGLRQMYNEYWMDSVDMHFRRDQQDALSVIKRGDWIELTGRVSPGGLAGWKLVDCQFLGRAEAPAPQSAPSS